MIKMFLTLSLIFLSIIMFFINHPLSMGMLILIQTLLLCLISGMLINTYWFSYILFLTFSGGLLVLFIYVSSIASNEMFKIKMKNKLLMLIYMIMLFMFSLYFMNNMYIMKMMMINEEMMNLLNSIYFLNEFNNINLSKLYNEQTYLMMMMMIIYLFITLIVVVKITNIFFGPLRSFN
uniref:NADH-ubiquinone oxidoreductase chain 6 n=1 Tax=Plebejus argus TaxID=242267 RepID=A0A6M3W4W1_PLEAR|nr:NADH dehydrogenase subunit 6 [Plebejus argus]